MRTQLDGVQGATVLDERTIRFDLKDRTADTIFNVGSAAGVLAASGALGADGKPKTFDEIVNEYPITTRPVHDRQRSTRPRRIDFERDPELLGARPGRARRASTTSTAIVYRYYQDNAVAMEAFKAGEFDFLMEYSARRWARQHDGPKWDDERIIKEEFPTRLRAGPAVVHPQPAPAAVPGPARARGARLAYDFEAINVYKQYKRDEQPVRQLRFRRDGPARARASSRCSSRSAPSCRPRCSARRGVPPRTDTGPNALRDNLKKARALLEEAGWKVGADGVLRNAKGEPFEFE